MFSDMDSNESKRHPHLILEGMRITELAKNIEEREHFFRYETKGGDRAFAASLLTDIIIHELCEGDGENLGKGFLENCRGDIWNFLFLDGKYQYADLEFSITEKQSIF